MPASVDTEVLNLTYITPSRTYTLKVELWANVYRPTTLPSSPSPVLIFLHGMHSTCERNSRSTPTIPPPSLLEKYTNWYSLTGTCDNPETGSLDESLYYDVIQNHKGYDYLGKKLASRGYVVVSINANLGIHAIGTDPRIPDSTAILPRGALVLRHLQKLKEWNDCTTDPDCQTPATLGVDLRGKLDFSNVGLMGHSRGGQGVRAAYNIYQKTGSIWQSRIPGLSIKGIFEIGPTDSETDADLLPPIMPNPDSKFVVNGTKWNVLLPMCDSDVVDLNGMNVYDRMLLSLSDIPPTQKSTYTVWGANHNFYNTV